MTTIRKWPFCMCFKPTTLKILTLLFLIPFLSFTKPSRPILHSCWRVSSISDLHRSTMTYLLLRSFRSISAYWTQRQCCWLLSCPMYTSPDLTSKCFVLHIKHGLLKGTRQFFPLCISQTFNQFYKRQASLDYARKNKSKSFLTNKPLVISHLVPLSVIECCILFFYLIFKSRNRNKQFHEKQIQNNN